MASPKKRTTSVLTFLTFGLLAGSLTDMAPAGAQVAGSTELQAAATAMEQGEFNAALGLYQKARKISEDSCLACTLGIAAPANRLGRFTTAEGEAQRALRELEGVENPHLRAWAYNELGNGLYGRSKLDKKTLLKAEQAFRKALELGEFRDEWPIRSNLGTVLEWLGREDEAMEVF